MGAPLRDVMADPVRHMRLDCPRCRVALERREHEIPGLNVHADHCPNCHGIYLDEGELKRLTGKRNVHQLITEYLGVDAGSDLVCPRCGGLMDDEHFEGAEGKVTIDVCISCHGVWLDAGELEAIEKLDDKKFDDLTPEKRAEVFDQDMARQRAGRGRNPLAGILGNFVHGLRMGTRRFR